MLNLPQAIGARIQVSNAAWMNNHELRREIEGRGFWTETVSATTVTLRRDFSDDYLYRGPVTRI